MLKDNWEEKHGTHVGNMIPQPPQAFSNNDHLAGSSDMRNVAALASSVPTYAYSLPPQSNFQDGRFGLSNNQPTPIEPVNLRHQFGNQLHQQNHVAETKPSFNAIPCVNKIEKRDNATHNMVSQSQLKDDDSKLQEVIKYLTANYGPMKTPLETGTPEYLKLVKILQQSAVQSNGNSDQRNGSTTDAPRVDENKLSSEKAAFVGAEKLWEGSLQLSSSVTLSAVASFKSGEKLLGNNYWPEFIEVKGKVRLEAFEKYVQDLPRSRNRGLMVISLYWNEESSNIGLNGMKEVTKGYKKSSRVGFAHLLSGTDLYICPRSDPIITILAKYGFFKGMSVLDDKPDSMIGCVVWRKNRPSTPIGNTSDGKSSPNSVEPLNSPPGFSTKQSTEKELSPEKKVTPESSQREEPLTLPLTTASAEVNHTVGNSSSSSSPLLNPTVSVPCNLVRKRNFEDDDLPEFDFGVSCVKSTLVTKPVNHVSHKLDNSPLTKLPKLEQSSKKAKIFNDDDDDMPEWAPPELQSQLPPQITTPKFQTLPSCPTRSLPLPPLPPIPPPPRTDTQSSFSYQPFRPAASLPPHTFTRLPPPPQPPLPLPPPPPRPHFTSPGGFNSNQALWHRPPSSNGNPPFPYSNRSRPHL